MIITFRRSFIKAAGSTWRELTGYLVYTFSVCVLYVEAGIHFLPIDTTPITILATALTLLLSFRNNSAYDRWWEARKIWGGIVNQSRTWGAQVLSLITLPQGETVFSSEDLKGIHREFIYRHLAYINMLRLQLRNQDDIEEIKSFLLESDWQEISPARNKATQLNLLQAQRLAEFRAKGLISDYHIISLQTILKEFYDLQGAAERIKNTPFPSIYDFSTRFFFWVFAALLPFALLENFGYKTVFFSWIVVLIFVELIRIGLIMQDPFLNHPNDTPMSSICRNIEIDLRYMLGETSVPAPIQPEDGVLM